MFKSVVVGVTDSEATRRAMTQAMDVAKATGGTLHLVAALRPHRPGPPTMPDEFRFSIGSVDPADWMLAQWQAEAAAASIPVTTHTVLADPVAAITQVADDEGADLIVVGASHGARHKASVSDTLLAKSTCAVLVI